MTRKKLEELNVIDNFMFNELTTQEDQQEVVRFCTIILQTILGKKLRNVRVIPQKPMQGMNTNLHGICMDVYVEAGLDRDGNEITDANVRPDIFDLEPNCYKDDEPHRARFYHALIDARSLQSGIEYQNMKNIFIIMIMPYDPFGLDRMVYTIRNHCAEEPEMPYEDGITTLFLYTRGKKDIPSQKVQDMLKFIEKSTTENAKGDELKSIFHMMERIKRQREVGIRYMKSWEIEKMIREEAAREGHAEGLAEGLSKGELFRLIRMTCKKLAKGYDAKAAAEMLEEDESTIIHIYHAAERFAPEYNVDAIYQELSSMKEFSVS